MTVQTSSPGPVQGRAHTFAYGDPLPPQVVNLLQDDAAAVSAALTGLCSRMFLPGVFTDDYTMPCIASPDTVTVADNVDFLTGGVFFNTHASPSRAFTIPDWSARYLRVEAHPDCGLVTAYETQPGVIADPLSRSGAALFILTEGDESDPAGQGGGLTTKSSMLLLKAEKAGPGAVPVVTLYPNKPGLGASSGDKGVTESDLGRPGGVATLDGEGRLQQPLGPAITDNVWLLTPLKAPMTINVATTGNDATADGAPGNPFQTIQAALLYLSGNYHLGVYDVTIQIAPGTYYERVELPQYMTTSGQVTLCGAGASNTIIDGATPPAGVTIAQTVGSSVRSLYTLDQLQIIAPRVTGHGECIRLGNGILTIKTLSLVIAPGTASGTALWAASNSSLTIGGATTVTFQTPGAQAVFCSENSSVAQQANVTATGTVTGAAVVCNAGAAYNRGPTLPTWSGSVTGVRYNVSLNATVNTSGGGVNFFPGTVAGVAGTGGQYA